MAWVIRFLVGAFAALFLIIGVRASLDPQSIITQFELGRQGTTGISAIRADMGGFFIGTGLAALVGLLPGKREWLLGAAVMVALAFIGRAIGLAEAGLTANIAQSMIIEAVSIVLLVAAFGILNPRRRSALAAAAAAERDQRADQFPQSTPEPQRDSDLAQPIV